MQNFILLLCLITLVSGCTKSSAERPEEASTDSRIAQLEFENRVLKFRDELETVIKAADSPEELCQQWSKTMLTYKDVAMPGNYVAEEKEYKRRLKVLKSRVLLAQKQSVQNQCVQEGVAALRSWMDKQNMYGWNVDDVEDIRLTMYENGMGVTSTVKVRKERFLIDDRARYAVTVLARMDSDCSSDFKYTIERIEQPQRPREFQ